MPSKEENFRDRGGDFGTGFSVASEDTAEAREPAWCHLLSRRWAEVSRSGGL
jgi:hypothetical protein